MRDAGQEISLYQGALPQASSAAFGARDYGRFDELAEEFTQRVRRGERPSLEEYIDRLPQRAMRMGITGRRRDRTRAALGR
jgi:hypothetical protein